MSITAMKQALEVLENIYSVRNDVSDAITALCQAIEQAEQTSHRDFRIPDGWKAERIDEYEIRVVSAGGEAWRLRSADKNDMFNNFIFQWAEAMLSVAPAAPAQQRPIGFVDHGGVAYWYNSTNTPPADTTELYAAPAQPLTDDDIERIALAADMPCDHMPDDYCDAIGIERGSRSYGDVDYPQLLAFARAIEAHIKGASL